jgi:hypothetical protein
VHIQEPKRRVKRTAQLTINRNKIVNVAASSDLHLGRRKVRKRGIETVLKTSPNKGYHESGFRWYVKRKEADR